uniref:Uncharacterized protein LOC100369743 n=1 Tax=Saccoglossus kowalevskii TaxID=10224 RepID=A0ABM0H164_SACKO|nr:PREDICTED: uncharacterized protein LOC100369743 [Saccoglossus kowalevskii]
MPWTSIQDAAYGRIEVAFIARKRIEEGRREGLPSMERVCKVCRANFVEDYCIAENIPKPVAFWPLNSEYGLDDVSGNGNHGTATGAVLNDDAYGRCTGAYEFTGNENSYIEFPNNCAYDTEYSLTMMAWVYPTGVDGPIFNYDNDGWGAHLWQTDASGAPDEFVRFVRRDRSFTDHLIVELNMNQWNLFAATYDYNTGMARLYLDGVLKTSLDIGVTTLATDYEARMGARIGDGRYFSGMITCMQVYDVALTESEIMAASRDQRCGAYAASVTAAPPAPIPLTAAPVIVAPTTEPSPPECRTVISDLSGTDDDARTEVQCESGEVMTGCNIYLPGSGHGTMDGAYFDQDGNGNTICVAQNGQGGTGVYAHARCCIWHKMSCEYIKGNQSTSATDDGSLAECPATINSMEPKVTGMIIFVVIID